MLNLGENKEIKFPEDLFSFLHCTVSELDEKSFFMSSSVRKMDKLFRIIFFNVRSSLVIYLTSLTLSSFFSGVGPCFISNFRELSFNCVWLMFSDSQVVLVF